MQETVKQTIRPEILAFIGNGERFPAIRVKKWPENGKPSQPFVEISDPFVKGSNGYPVSIRLPPPKPSAGLVPSLTSLAFNFFFIMKCANPYCEKEPIPRSEYCKSCNFIRLKGYNDGYNKIFKSTEVTLEKMALEAVMTAFFIVEKEIINKNYKEPLIDSKIDN